MIFILGISLGLLNDKPINKSCYQNSLLPNSQLILYFGSPCIYAEQYNVNMKGQAIARVIRQTLTEAGAHLVDNNFNTSWEYQLEFGSQFTETDYKSLVQHNITASQIPCHKVFTQKNELALNIQKFTQQFSDLKLVPLTYVVPNDLQKIFNILVNNDIKTNFMQFKKPQQQYYIFKKAISARGHGIKLLNSVDELKTQLNILSGQEGAVLQEYLTNTVLINGYKFDIRIYFVITSIDPFIVHVYKDGIGRLATHKFVNPNSFNQDDLRMHLTNFAINKQKENESERYNTSDMFYKQSYRDILSYLSEHKDLFLRKTKQDPHNLRQMSKQQLKEHLESQINKTLYKSLIILKDKLQKEYQVLNFSRSEYNKQFFGLYGADMIFLDNSDALLLEINLQPALGISTDVDKRVKQQLTKDVFNIVGLRSTITINVQYSKDLLDKYNILFDEFKTYIQQIDQSLFDFYEKHTNDLNIAIIQLIDEMSRQNGSFDMLIPNYQGISFSQYTHRNKKDEIMDHFAKYMKTKQFRTIYQQLVSLKAAEDSLHWQQKIKDEL